jgi:hypothetical protein
MARKHLAALALLASLSLGALPSCSKTVVAGEVVQQSWSVDAAGEGGWFEARVRTDDEQGSHEARIRIAPDVPCVWRAGTTFFYRGGQGKLSLEGGDGLFARDERVEVEDRSLLVGGRSFGVLPDGAEVDLRSDGVFVNGERREEAR